MGRKTAVPAGTVCSPTRDGIFDVHGTCFSARELRALAFLYNHSFPDRAIPNAALRSRGRLVQELRARIPECDDDACLLARPWLQKYQGIVVGLRREALRPSAPETWKANRYEWLTNIDILQVMHQYEAKHKRTFRFLDVAPNDFASCAVSPAMCEFDSARALRSGKRTFGAIMNLDSSRQPGSHWVAMFGNLDPRAKNYGICYFDSTGRAPTPEVMAFMKRVHDTRPATHARHKFYAYINRRQYQFKNTECGVFAMMFVILHLENPDLPHGDIASMIGDDEDMNAMRRHLFRND